jgi:hypothetical protein
MDEHVQDLPLWNGPQVFGILEELCNKHHLVDVFRELVAEILGKLARRSRDNPASSRLHPSRA